jgi:hypothetical protein
MLNKVLVLALGIAASQSFATGASAKAADPVSTFKPIAARYTTFFGADPVLLHSENFPKSPTGKVFALRKYMSDEVSYDVQKTDSLVSPFTAYVKLHASVADNAQGGDLKFEYTGTGRAMYFGYSTLDAAKAADTFSSDFELPKGSKTRPPVTITFRYADQDGKWIYKGQTEDGGSPNQELAEFALAAALKKPANDPLNQPWVDFFKAVAH